MALPAVLGGRRGRGLAAVAALTLVQGLAAGAGAFATRTLFDAMQGGGALPLASLVILGAAGAVIAVTRVGARWLGERLGQDYARQIRIALFDHAARMPARAVAMRRAGYVSLRFVGDMTAFRNWLGLGLPRLVASAVFVPAMLAVLWFLHPAFGVAVLPVVVATLLMISFGGMRLVPLQRRLRMRRARIAAEMAERMPLAPQLDRMGRRNREIAQLNRRTDAMVSTALRLRLTAETIAALPDIAAGLGAVLVILRGHQLGLTTGTIAAGLAVLGLLLAPLRDLGGIWNYHAAFRAAAAKARAVLSRGTRDLYRGGQALPAGPIALQFDGVTLPSGTLLAHDIAAGAICAPGLSELDAAAVFDILLGLDTPATGRIMLSGIDLRDLTRGSLRRGVLRVGSTPAILHGSLRRVLRLGDSRAHDDAYLIRIAQAEGLGSLLERIGGLGGTVTEAGRNLTHAERLAISVVRLRLGRPRLVLVDADTGDAVLARTAHHLRRHPATVIIAGPVHAAPQRERHNSGVTTHSAGK